MHADPLTVWLLILGGGAVVYVTRAVFILPGRSLKLSPDTQRLLRYAPAAALMAIIAPDLGTLQGELALNVDNLRLLAGLAGFAIAAWTRSVLFTILGGMLVLTALRLIVGAL